MPAMSFQTGTITVTSGTSSILPSFSISQEHVVDICLDMHQEPHLGYSPND